MKTQFGKWFLVLVCTFTIVAGTASTCDAGVIPCIWNLLFGPCRGGYSRGYYHPGYLAAPRGISSGCYPTTAFYPPQCSPFGYAACGPCRSICSIPGVSSCPKNICAVSYQKSSGKSSGLVPDPVEAELPKTYADEAAETNEKYPSTNDDGFRPRSNGADPEPLDSLEIKAFKRPAPIAPPVEDKNKLDIREPNSKKTGTPQSNRLPIPMLNFDNAVTWRVIPKRSRLTLRVNFVNPTVARHKLYLSTDWMPVPEEIKIAKK